MSNPFSLSFDAIPNSIIDSPCPSGQIICDFSEENPPYHAVMISGVRGSGKTVFLTELSHFFEKNPEWIVCHLNPHRDMFSQLAGRLCLSIQTEGSPVIADTAIALDKLLKASTRKGKRVLVAIDEVVPTASMREFASQFQIFMREGCQIFLIMTGLYDNIRNLQDASTLTFLYRAPRIDMPPLALNLMAREYRKLLNCTDRTAMELAAATRGYPFAYQALGWHVWNLKDRSEWKTCLENLDQTLQDLVYEKIWSEISGRQKDLLKAVQKSTTDQVSEIRRKTGMNPQEFSVYRDRLLKKQILISPAYASLAFNLPRFEQFVQRQTLLEEILKEE